MTYTLTPGTAGANPDPDPDPDFVDPDFVDDPAIDYSHPNRGTFTLIGGETDDCVDIDISNNAVPEPLKEVFTLHFNPAVSSNDPRFPIEVRPAFSTATIEDDDPLVVSLTAPDRVAEGDAAEATVEIMSLPEGAMLNGTYTLRAGGGSFMIIGAGATMSSTTISVNITDDMLSEPDETFELRLNDDLTPVLGRTQAAPR